MGKKASSGFDRSFLLEYMNDVKEMIREFQSEFTDTDSWDHSYGVNLSADKKPAHAISTQLWETSDKYFLNASLPGVDDRQNIQISFKDEQTLHIEATHSSLQPMVGSFLVHSEFPESLEREIILPQQVSTDNYTYTFKNGILAVILSKLVQDVDIPIDF